MCDLSLYEKCTLCPRKCSVNRNNGMGFCGETSILRIGRAGLHLWEEPCISGSAGSGTVFFSGCTMKCVFCQNYVLSHQGCGKTADADRLSDIFLEFQNKGAHNINLVSGEHFVPHIVLALDKAKTHGLSIPVIFNCSGYVDVETLKMLNGYIDVYLPDFKYFDNETSFCYSKAKDYVEIAKIAIEEMVSQQPKIVFDDDEMISKGVIVRHLCLPGKTEESKAIIGYLFKKYGNNILMSIMNQYTPLENVEKYPEINRKLTQNEYDDVLDYCMKIGIENAYIQEDGTVDESFIPRFDGEGV